MRFHLGLPSSRSLNNTFVLFEVTVTVIFYSFHMKLIQWSSKILLSYQDSWHSTSCPMRLSYSSKQIILFQESVPFLVSTSHLLSICLHLELQNLVQELFSQKHFQIPCYIYISFTHALSFPLSLLVQTPHCAVVMIL